jgi:hypothetical protein
MKPLPSKPRSSPSRSRLGKATRRPGGRGDRRSRSARSFLRADWLRRWIASPAESEGAGRARGPNRSAVAMSKRGPLLERRTIWPSTQRYGRRLPSNESAKRNASE